MLRPLTTLGFIGATLFGFGCTGTPTGPGDQPPEDGKGGTGVTPGTGGTPGAGGTKGPEGLPSDAASVPGVAPLRRLTRFEYENTVRDLLGIPVPAARLASFSADQEAGNSGFMRGGSITAPPDVRVFMLAAEELAAAATKNLSTLLSCAPTNAASEDTCVDKFIPAFGRRAYRRPLVAGRGRGASRPLQGAAPAPSRRHLPAGLGNLVTAMLQSPYFLYHWELGPNAGHQRRHLVRFNQYEMASRLSYLFWGSMPDDKLFAAADAGSSSTPDEIAERGPPPAGRRQGPRRPQRLPPAVAGDRRPRRPAQGPVAHRLFAGGRAVDAEGDAGVRGQRLPGPQGRRQARDAADLAVVVRRRQPGQDLRRQERVAAPTCSRSTLDADAAGRLVHPGAFLTSKADAIDSHPVKRGDTVLNRLLCIALESRRTSTSRRWAEPPGRPDHARAVQRSQRLALRDLPQADRPGRLRLRELRRHRPLPHHRGGQDVDATGSFALGIGPR